jgi:hypothetical protein
MTPGTAALVAFDVPAAIREAQDRESSRTPEDRERAALAIARARFEAAEFLVDGGSPADARLAARWLLARAA